MIRGQGFFHTLTRMHFVIDAVYVPFGVRTINHNLVMKNEILKPLPQIVVLLKRISVNITKVSLSVHYKLRLVVICTLVIVHCGKNLI